ncbi:Uncharacterised protein [Vibrio cholerae]|nr:Uncharacterised protein [Vibrio cholerae]
MSKSLSSQPSICPVMYTKYGRARLPPSSSP